MDLYVIWLSLEMSEFLSFLSFSINDFQTSRPVSNSKFSSPEVLCVTDVVASDGHPSIRAMDPCILIDQVHPICLAPNVRVRVWADMVCNESESLGVST